MVVFATQVWRMIVSPRDKNLKSRYELTFNENQKILVDLYSSNENVLDDYYDDDDAESVNSRRKLSKYKCFKREDKYVTRYYLARPEHVVEQVSKRKLIVIFPGRNFSLAQIKKIKYFEKMYKTNQIDDYDVAVLIYPIKAKNLNMLSESCSKALSHLIHDHGYSQANISIMGWCLGGYFANETLEHYYKANPSSQKFNCFLNNKSFASISEFLYCILPKYIRFVLRLYPVKFYVRLWNQDSSKSIESIQQMFNKLYVIYSDKDHIINGKSHLYKHLPADPVQTGNLKVMDDLEQPSHLPNWNLICKLFNSA